MSDNHEKRVKAYDRMLERAKSVAPVTESEKRPYLLRAIDYAREKAVELGELTREEAEDIADYLRRDIHDAATYLGEHGNELRDWLQLDLILIEDRLLDLFSQVVDKTRLELDLLAMNAETADWKTGEVTGIGTLECVECGELLHFHKTGHIPPCPRCNATTFRRVID
ncbi:MAG: zinc ribbon-containing protein [Pseudomonadota bacterium]